MAGRRGSYQRTASQTRALNEKEKYPSIHPMKKINRRRKEKHDAKNNHIHDPSVDHQPFKTTNTMDNLPVLLGDQARNIDLEVTEKLGRVRVLECVAT
jgi:hypothetical protein